MNVIKIDVRDDLGNLNPYMVMPMALTALNPDPKSWTVYEFDGDKSSNVVMIIYPKFLLVNTRWYLRWRHHEFGFENWVKNPLDYNRYKANIDFQKIDEIVTEIRRNNQITEILK